MKIYIGIDNGVSGAAVAIDDSGKIIDYLVMPIQKARRRNEVDVRAFVKWLSSISANWIADIKVIIEEPGGSKSASAAVSMEGSFQALRGALESRRASWERITPRSWQKIMIPGCKTGETKPRALECAKRLWPDQDWKATPRCKVPHAGLVDAALIAEYARRTNL
jgi:hypothetical protein